VAEEKFEFSLGADGDGAVDGWEGLLLWLAKERAKWTWLVPGDGATDAHGWASNIQNTWNVVVNNVTAIRDQGNPIEAARPHLQPLAAGPLLSSEVPDGALILEIREAAGDTAASFAFAFLKAAVNVGNARNRDELRGAMLTVIPDVVKPTEISERLQRERANYRSAIRSAIERIDEADRVRASEFDALRSRGTRIANRMLWRSRDNWRRVQKAWQSQATQAVSEINAVQAAYLEAMHLQAPVKYWSDKAKAHGKKEFWGIIRLVAFFPVALAGLGFAFWKAGTYLLDHAANPEARNPVALYVVITGGLAVISTLLFWVGRLLTKLYLSEHHLRNDAEERAVMTETYLALTKDSAASDTDRDIILAAIFRSTPDGIVREDGPGDFTLQALLAKFMASPR
jgi:hypothetical protein